MASTDIVILSSSPPRQLVSYNMSSSPGLPSPSEIFKKKPPVLRTGSQAAPIPQNSSSSFTSASVLLKKATTGNTTDTIRSFRLEGADHLDIREDLKPAKTKVKKLIVKKVAETKPAKSSRKAAPKDDDGAEVKKVRKPRVKKTEETMGEDVFLKDSAPKQPRVKKSDKDVIGSEVAKDNPVRKSRAKKADGDSQTKLSNGKITKPSTSKKSRKAKDTSKAEKATETLDPLEETLDFGLVEAVKRRSAWTPPTQTSKTISITPNSVGILDTALGSSGSIASGAKRKGFNDLLGSFGFTNSDAGAVEKKARDMVIRKRKLIELVKTNIAGATAQPKEKAPKKKARTITEQATSAYADEEPAQPAPLLQYFSYQTTDRTTDGFKAPAKPRSRSPLKASTKKGSAVVPILLSPESAMKRVGNQDFVFGTSSQLAREESPTLLQDIHEAMQVSNEVDPLINLIEEPEPVGFSWGKAVSSKKGVLWSAASRGADSELLDIEMVDLVDSPAIPKQKSPSAIGGKAASKASKNNEWPDIDELSNSLIDKHELPQKSPKHGPVEAAIRTEPLSSPPASNKTLHKSSPKTPQPKPPSKVTAPATKSSKLGAPEMPDYSAYTTAQLAKEIASYHFKPVKNREQMITLLQRCWEGKHRTALTVLNTKFAKISHPKASKSVPPSSQMEASPKRPRGQPRKEVASSPPGVKTKSKGGCPKKADTVEYLELDSDAPLSKIRTPKKSQIMSKQPVDEISDSDTPCTPSPPRRPVSKIKPPPKPLQLKSDDMEASPELSSTEVQALLYRHITSAVTNATPSKDPTNPSWHEKILLYDPIILEDLAVWLNTGALEKAGWDGEVSAWEVKKWCESNSICCLWKENLRGGARSRY